MERRVGQHPSYAGQRKRSRRKRRRSRRQTRTKGQKSRSGGEVRDESPTGGLCQALCVEKPSGREGTGAPVSMIFHSKRKLASHTLQINRSLCASIPTTLRCLTYIIPLPLAPREAPKIRMWLNSGHSNPFPIPGNRKGIRVIAVKIQTPAKMYRLSAREEILVHSMIKEQRTKSPCI